MSEHRAGVPPAPGNRVVYDVDLGDARTGDVGAEGHALVWVLSERPHSIDGALLTADVELDPSLDWLMRCDRVDFPIGGVAYRHVHPGPGIRYLLHGSIEIAGPDGPPHIYRPGEAWLEGADYPVLATASGTVETAFVRVLVLPQEWRGKRTIRYVDPADEERPKLQRATIFLEQPLDLE